jgi:hypothetical protein
MNSQIRARFEGNIVRVRHLVTVYDNTTGSGRGRRTAESSDVLRAAVVLLHAALEDVLRSLERRVLPQSSADTLDTVPLKGLQRPAKFSLGSLAAYRGKAVDDLIDESVEAYLQRMTYNNADELAEGLKRLGADVTKVNRHFATLTALMKRRHQIVHRADRDEARGSGHHPTRSLSKTQVVEWTNVAEDFVRGVFAEVPDISGAAP